MIKKTHRMSNMIIIPSLLNFRLILSIMQYCFINVLLTNNIATLSEIIK